MKHSKILKNLTSFLIGLNSLNSDDIKLYIALISAINSVSKLNGTNLLVAYIKADPEILQSSGYSNQEIIRTIERMGVRVIDVSLTEDASKIPAKYMVHRLDKHPSKEANEARARIIAAELKL